MEEHNFMIAIRVLSQKIDTLEFIMQEYTAKADALEAENDRLRKRIAELERSDG